MTLTAGDQLAAHVRQVFNLDKEKQKATLASLSVYADEQRQENWMAPAAKGYKSSESAVKIPVASTVLRTDLHGAVPGMESHLATERAATEPMKVLLGGTSAAIPALPLSSPAPAGDPWNKVVEELGSNLPKEVTAILQDLLAQAETWDSSSLGQQQPLQPQGRASQMPEGKIAAVRFLMQQLEKDQEASVRRVHSMLQHPCSMHSGLGMNLPLQPSSAMPLPFTKEAIHECSLRCKDVAGFVGSGAQAAKPEESSFFDALQYPQLPAAMHVGDSVPHGGAILTSGAEGHQRLAAVVGKGVEQQSVERYFSQNSRRSGMMGQPQAAQAAVPAGGPQATLRVHLQSLLHVDPDRVLIVRKINRLGFASRAVLSEHFSWYGVVERVLVAHSRVKSVTAGGGKGASVVRSRLRPSALGFLVMSRAEDAQAILAHGSRQPVNGIMVHIQEFKRHVPPDAEDCNDDERDTGVPETSLSEKSCRSPSSSTSCEESS